jgi:hypothetical protein
MISDFYTHDKFIDVMFFLKKAFYIKEKDLWELKVTWWNTRGWELGDDKLYITDNKRKEFRRC